MHNSFFYGPFKLKSSFWTRCTTATPPCRLWTNRKPSVVFFLAMACFLFVFFYCFCRSVHGQGVCLWFMSCLQFTEFPTVKVPVYYDWVWYWLLKTTEEFYVGWHCFDCVAFVCLSTHHLPGELSERDQKPLQGGCRHARENSTCRRSHSRHVSVDMMV